ncbi:MAG TPA: hypothetical protein VGN89_01620, partial [Phenylobacterium sp.]|nr:hypothetical protein [Phenylobacterium sp.]
MNPSRAFSGSKIDVEVENALRRVSDDAVETMPPLTEPGWLTAQQHSKKGIHRGINPAGGVDQIEFARMWAGLKIEDEPGPAPSIP